MSEAERVEIPVQRCETVSWGKYRQLSEIGDVTRVWNVRQALILVESFNLQTLVGRRFLSPAVCRFDFDQASFANLFWWWRKSGVLRNILRFAAEF